jgi:hypothetical protein
MRRFFVFWRRCAWTAAKGNSAFANDWQWLVGYPVTAAGLWFLGYFYAEYSGRVEVTLTNGALGALAAAGIAFVITWVAAFVVRLFYEPVALFHAQKDRADKLEGVDPDKIPPKKDRTVAELQARYLSPRGQLQRGYLDYEAEADRAIKDVKTIFDGIGARTTKLTKFILKYNQRFASAKDAHKKREVAKSLADYLDAYSDQIVEFATIVRGLTPILLECTTQFVQRGNPRNDADFAVLDGFAKSIHGNVTSVQANLGAINNTVSAFSRNFMGITHDLTTANLRMTAVMGHLHGGFEEYISACEQIRSSIERKIEDGKKKLQEV